MPTFSVDLPSDDQLAARRQLDEARQKSLNRKRDVRRKIIAGAALLTEAQTNPVVGQLVRRILKARVTRPVDQAVIADLLDGAS
jgi:hypothetical protein